MGGFRICRYLSNNRCAFRVEITHPRFEGNYLIIKLFFSEQRWLCTPRRWTQARHPAIRGQHRRWLTSSVPPAQLGAAVLISRIFLLKCVAPLTGPQAIDETEYLPPVFVIKPRTSCPSEVGLEAATDAASEGKGCRSRAVSERRAAYHRLGGGRSGHSFPQTGRTAAQASVFPAVYPKVRASASRDRARAHVAAGMHSPSEREQQ